MAARKIRIVVDHGHIVFSKTNIQLDTPGAQSPRPLECLHRIFNILPVACASMSYYFRPWDFGIGRVPAQITNQIRRALAQCLNRFKQHSLVFLITITQKVTSALPPKADRCSANEMSATGQKRTSSRSFNHLVRPCEEGRRDKISLIVYVNGQPNLPRQPMRIALSWGTASRLGGTKNWENGRALL